MRYTFSNSPMDDEDFAKFIVSMVIMALAVLGGLYLYARVWFWYVLVGTTVVALGVIFFIRKRNRDREDKFEVTYQIIRAKHASVINNFIDQFGREKEKGAAFSFQGHNFSNAKLKYLQDDFEAKGIRLDDEDLFRVLRRFIDERERDYTTKAINGSTSQQFGSLSGSEFEALLKRLSEKMGYTVQLTGKTGDQGGDLVAIKGDERVVIQAKRYKDGSKVGNDAVQQVIAAKGYYSCTSAKVITTSTFTPEANEIARVHNVDLIDGKRLRRFLLSELNESWS